MKKNQIKNIIVHAEKSNVPKLRKLLINYLKNNGKKVAINNSAENGRCREQNCL